MDCRERSVSDVHRESTNRNARFPRERMGQAMREDALYYTQREQAERALADTAADPRVRKIHALLASKYSELAQRELAKLEASEYSVH